MNIHEFEELSAGHAMGALSAEDERAYVDALAAHPEWEGIALADGATAAALAEGAAPVAPPADLRAKLLTAIAVPDAPGQAPADTAATLPSDQPVELAPAAPQRRWRRTLFTLAASIVLVVGLGWGVGALTTLWQTPAAVTALEQIESAPDAASAETAFDGGVATVHWSTSIGKVVLVADGLPSIGDDRTFELWYVRDATPISAGTFSAADAGATAELNGQMQAGDTIAVTIEPAGGAPQGTPTGEMVFAIPTA